MKFSVPAGDSSETDAGAGTAQAAHASQFHLDLSWLWCGGMSSPMKPPALKQAGLLLCAKSTS